jgi:hypothetical protein
MGTCNTPIIEGLKEVEASLKDSSTNMLGDLEKRLQKAKNELEKWMHESISDSSVG